MMHDKLQVLRRPEKFQLDNRRITSWLNTGLRPNILLLITAEVADTWYELLWWFSDVDVQAAVRSWTIIFIGRSFFSEKMSLWMNLRRWRAEYIVYIITELGMIFSSTLTSYNQFTLLTQEDHPVIIITNRKILSLDGVIKLTHVVSKSSISRWKHLKLGYLKLYTDPFRDKVDTFVGCFLVFMKME